jgi:hypothetical protein
VEAVIGFMAHIWFVIACYSLGALGLLYVYWSDYRADVAQINEDIAFERTQHEWIESGSYGRD